VESRRFIRLAARRPNRPSQRFGYVELGDSVVGFAADSRTSRAGPGVVSIAVVVVMTTTLRFIAATF
jgi:hypothetical protein